jgi:2-keto-4-pentenoate hydratase/2-oxohepta-3-ene-1,7-dioic acid hydratase in catechol pathway
MVPLAREKNLRLTAAPNAERKLMAGYRLASYQSTQGPRAGIVVAETLFDAAELTGEPGYATTLGILADWPRAQAMLAAALGKAAPGTRAMPLQQARLRAPVLWPSAIYCAGANYSDHAAEMARRANRPLEPDPKSLGLKPWFFIKASRAVTDPEATVTASHYTKKLDWEAELAAVIGRPAKNVAVAQALDYVAGYTIANDLSARDRSRREKVSETSAFRSDWTSQKSFDGSCPLGPWIVPAQDIPDPQNLAIKLWVNDVLKQDSNTGKMIFNIAEQIAHLSAGMTLHPGDVILTGTPAGVGTARGEFLQPGDAVRIEIERIGTLSNKIA